MSEPKNGTLVILADDLFAMLATQRGAMQSGIRVASTDETRAFYQGADAVLETLEEHFKSLLAEVVAGELPC